MSFHSVLVLTRGARNEDSHELTLLTGAHQVSLGTRLAMSLQSVLVKTGFAVRTGENGVAWEQGKPRDCTPYWCSHGEPRNNASPGIVFSALVLTRGARDEASLELALRTGAYQESLGTRLAMSLQSVLVLNRGAWEQV